MTKIPKPGMYRMASGKPADIRYVDEENAFGYISTGFDHGCWEVWATETGECSMGNTSDRIVSEW
jgi:hypothetical protein